MLSRLNVLLDQNVPISVKAWLQGYKPEWQVLHASDVKLDRLADEEVFRWAQSQQALIITFDEDFADQRSFSSNRHFGIVRLRVWPTTAEEVKAALLRLFEEVSETELSGSLVIIDSNKIRVRFRAVK